MRFASFALVLVVLVLGVVNATYLATKGGAMPTKGGLAPPAKGQTYPAKGQVAQPPLKGLLKPAPVLPTKGRKPIQPPPRVEQKIEQTVQQQEELEQVQQQVEQKVEQTVVKRPIGIVKWEQRIEQMPNTRTTATYYKKKNVLKPQVEQVQQQLEQTVQQQEEVVQQVEQQVEQKIEQRPLAQRPLYTQPKKPARTEQRVIYNNVRQLPTTYDANAGWD